MKNVKRIIAIGMFLGIFVSNSIAQVLVKKVTAGSLSSILTMSHPEIS